MDITKKEKQLLTLFGVGLLLIIFLSYSLIASNFNLHVFDNLFDEVSTLFEKKDARVVAKEFLILLGSSIVIGSLVYGFLSSLLVLFGSLKDIIIELIQAVCFSLISILSLKLIHHLYDFDFKLYDNIKLAFSSGGMDVKELAMTISVFFMSGLVIAVFYRKTNSSIYSAVFMVFLFNISMFLY